MDLRTYLNQAPRGTGAAIARALRVHSVMVSQWAAGTKPVPEERAPALEAATEFLVPCEDSCPDTRWVRVQAEGWPNGKPLADKAPALPCAPIAVTAVSHAAAVDQRNGQHSALPEAKAA